MKDPIREYLKKKGCPEHVFKGGLKGLIETWETVVIEVSHGYDLTLEDYLNDMDSRQLIEEIRLMASTPAEKSLIKKLGRLDAMMKTLVDPREQSIWGKDSANRTWLDALEELVVLQPTEESRTGFAGRS